MYPGGNNYNQGYPNQQPGYNSQPKGFGGVPSYAQVSAPPPIGFNVGNPNQAPGYSPGNGQQQGGYNPYPANPYPTNPPTQGQSYAPQGQSYAPQGQSYAPQGQSYAPQGQSYAPQGQSYAPQGQTYAPQGQSYAPQGQSCAPQGQINATQGQNQPGHAPPACQGFGNPNQQVYEQQMIQHGQHSNMSAPDHTNSQMSIDCIGSLGETYRGSIKPFPNFNAEQDCNVLRKAMKGLGTDEKAIIECLGRRNLAQRLEIKKTFKTMFGKDLIDELKSELSGNFSRAVTESLYDSDYYDAYSLRKAMEGAGTREDVLTEILTSRSNQQIENIKDLYKKLYGKILEKDVISETSGFYKRVLVSCLQANKKELTGDEIMRLRQQGPSAVVNMNMARQEAQELYNAGEKKLGTDEACFIKIFASRNKYQLRATFEEYKKVAGRDIISSIEREMSGDLASSLKAIAMQAIDPALYFASRLYKSMKGAGTNDTALIRILLTRSEIDMENIKSEFQKQFKKTLDSFVRGDTSGDYMKYLLRFLEGN